MAHHVIASDLDGTLVTHVGDVIFDNADSLGELCVRDRKAQRRILDFVELGHDVHVVTARGRKVRGITLQQVRDIHPDIVLHHQERFEGFTAMRDWKAKVLRQIGAEVYIGDHLVDELAAGDAGIPFVHVDEFRSGKDVLALLGEPSSSQAEGGALGNHGALEQLGVKVRVRTPQVQNRNLRVSGPTANRAPKVRLAGRAVARDDKGVHAAEVKPRRKAARKGGR